MAKFDEGESVAVERHAVKGPHPAFARFWFATKNGKRVWVIGWERPWGRGYVYNVDPDAVQPTAPNGTPDMPDYTQEQPCGLSWLRRHIKGDGRG